MSEKLIELEEKIVYLDHIIEELKDDSKGGTQVVNDRPPHY